MYGDEESYGGLKRRGGWACRGGELQYGWKQGSFQKQANGHGAWVRRRVHGRQRGGGQKRAPEYVPEREHVAGHFGEAG